MWQSKTDENRGKDRTLDGTIRRSVFMLASKFMLPTTVRVIIEGQSTYVQVVPSVYTTLNCVIIAIFSFLLGANAFYLLSIRFRTHKKERIWQEAEQEGTGSENTAR